MKLIASKPDCDSPGYTTQLECCQTACGCGGQVSGACIRQLPTSPTDMIGKWYANYVARRCQMPAAW